MTPAEQIALLRDALEKLLWEAEDGYATCPLTREQASAALSATAAPAEQNFCPRCGKRTDSVHTCTPPVKEST